MISTHGHHACEKLKLEELFLKYEGAKSKEEKERVLDQIGETMGTYHNHPKPMDLIRKSNKASKEEEKKNKLHCKKAVYDTLFKVSDFISDAEQITYGIANSLHKCYWNDLDFNKLTDDGFLDFVGSATSLADINNESFMQKFASALDQKCKNDIYYNFN
jgi:hypothetical protein